MANSCLIGRWPRHTIDHRCFNRRAAWAAAVAIALALPHAAFAQADPDTVAQTERIKAETDLEKAKADRLKAEADRITALGLPKFEGKTDLGANAGAMEATLLSTRALGAAPQAVATESTESGKPKILVLTKDEVLDMGEAAAIQFEMDAIGVLFSNAEALRPAPLHIESFPVLPAISALAGLLRSDATLSYLDAAAIDDRMFVWAVASKLPGQAVLPGARIGGEVGDAGKAMIEKLRGLAARRLSAGKRRGDLADVKKPTGRDKDELAALTAAITRYDAFFARVTTATDKGVVPFIAAARVSDLLGNGYPVLRLHVDKAGGSLVNTKNIATTFGIDPLKISGGIVVSYLLTNPATGDVAKADVLSCHTTLTSIRRVQERSWTEPSTLCASAFSKTGSDAGAN
jgi:hypothetical protein